MNSSSQNAIRKPFIDHVHELRRRLLICVFFVVVGSGIGYALNNTLARLIQQPLHEKLYFTSPTGGFNFIFVICLSFGVVVALPCIIYQILAFARPLLPQANRANMFLYPLCSVFLAGLGVLFAYFISLPAALHFLTTIGGGANIQSLITTDSYFRFALAYLIGFAVLFQLPLLMIIINRVTPLQPRKLMKSQRYVILGSFIIAAILTPTPDPFNQTIMAGPIIVLYEFSILLVWSINIKRRKPVKQQPNSLSPKPAPTQATNHSAALKPKPPKPRLVYDVIPPRAPRQRPSSARLNTQLLKQRPIMPPRPRTNGLQGPNNLIDIVRA